MSPTLPGRGVCTGEARAALGLLGVTDVWREVPEHLVPPKAELQRTRNVKEPHVAGCPSAASVLLLLEKHSPRRFPEQTSVKVLVCEVQCSTEALSQDYKN